MSWSVVTPLGLRMEIEQDAVAQHRVRKRAHIIEVHVIATLRHRPGLASEDQVLGCTNAGPVCHPLLDEVGWVTRVGAGGPDQVERVPQHGFRHRDLADQLLKGHKVSARHGMLKVVLLYNSRGSDDLQLLALRWMLDDDVEHEPVELRLRQRIRALELDRILRREDEKWLIQLVGPPLYRDPVLLHRLEQCRLRLGRGPVDLVRQQNVGKHRSRREHHLSISGLRVFLDDVGAGDVGRHQIRRELDPRELEIQHLRHRLDQQRLGQTGDTDDDAVATDQQGEERLLDHVLLADDQLVHLAEKTARGRPSACRPGRCRPVIRVQ